MDPLSSVPQSGSSAFAPGDFLEDLLESVLMNMGGAIARHAKLRPKTSRDRAFEINWRGQARKVITSMGTDGIGFLVFAMVSLSSTVVVAQDYRGTADQRTSCMPDAFRLCASYIPDAANVEICLRQRKFELSEACRSIFKQNDGLVASRIRNEPWRAN